LSLCLTKHHAKKAYWRSGGIAPALFTSALDGGEWSASRLGRFTPRKRAPSAHRIGGWVGPRAVLDAVVKRKIPNHLQESNLIVYCFEFNDCYEDLSEVLPLRWRHGESQMVIFIHVSFVLYVCSLCADVEVDVMKELGPRKGVFSSGNKFRRYIAREKIRNEER
jgi:hypothetical protein